MSEITETNMVILVGSKYVCGDACGVHCRALDGLWITRAHLNVV